MITMILDSLGTVVTRSTAEVGRTCGGFRQNIHTRSISYMKMRILNRDFKITGEVLTL